MNRMNLKMKKEMDVQFTSKTASLYSKYDTHLIDIDFINDFSVAISGRLPKMYRKMKQTFIKSNYSLEVPLCR